MLVDINTTGFFSAIVNSCNFTTLTSFSAKRYGWNYRFRMRYGYEQIDRIANSKGAIMPSDRKIEGILMPMPVAFKKDGRSIMPGRTRSLISIWMPACTVSFRWAHTGKAW